MTKTYGYGEATTGSGVPRRVLAQYLRNLRLQSGLTIKVAAGIMEWSEPKMWRIETGQNTMRAMDVEAMCAVYNAPPDLTRALSGLARQTKADGWWHSYAEATSERFSIYDTLEDAASGLRSYAAGQVPALLRTEAHARALINNSNPGRTDTEQLVRECLNRQTLIARASAPLPVTFILSECLLRHPVGGAAVAAGQLRHLAEISLLPNICLRMMPFSAGTHPGLATGTFTLLQFPPSGGTDSSPAIVHTAGLTGELFLDKPDEIRSYTEAYDTIAGYALDEVATRELLYTTAKTLEQ